MTLAKVNIDNLSEVAVQLSVSSIPALFAIYKKETVSKYVKRILNSPASTRYISHSYSPQQSRWSQNKKRIGRLHECCVEESSSLSGFVVKKSASWDSAVIVDRKEGLGTQDSPINCNSIHYDGYSHLLLFSPHGRTNMNIPPHWKSLNTLGGCCPSGFVSAMVFGRRA